MFPPKVSNILSELSTKEGFLVQGSPLSGEIANLVFYQNEPKLVKYCQEQGLRYTRYYDDIHISSDVKDFYELIPHLKSEIYRIFGKSGVKPHRSKKKAILVHAHLGFLCTMLLLIPKRLIHLKKEYLK